MRCGRAMWQSIELLVLTAPVCCVLVYLVEGNARSSSAPCPHLPRLDQVVLFEMLGGGAEIVKAGSARRAGEHARTRRAGEAADSRCVRAVV